MTILSRKVPMNIYGGVRAAIFKSTIFWGCLCLFVSVMAVLVAGPTPAAAQEPVPAVDETQANYLVPQPTAPMLAGHRFIQASNIQGPFIRTMFRNTIGVGVSSGISIPVIEIGGEEYHFETGSLLYSTIQAEYQNAVKDWLSVWVEFQIVGRLGTETSSLLTQGVTVINGFDFGWLLKIWERDDMQLSGSVRVVKSSYTAVDLIGFIEGVIEGVPESENSLVRTVPVLIGTTGLRYAWAINQVVGLTTLGAVGFGDSPDRKADSQWYFDLGALVDFDLRRKYSAPIGLALGANIANMAEQDQAMDGNIATAIGRIDYIGRIDFNLGLEVMSRWYDHEGFEESLRYTTVTMDFRYFF